MRYAVDPIELVALWDRWDEVSNRLVVARGRLPEGLSVYLPGRAGALDTSIDSLLGALRHCLSEAAQAADEAGRALAEAAGAYGRADSAFQEAGD